MIFNRKNAHAQDVETLDYDHVLANATIAYKLFTTQEKIKIVKVEYVNPTGLAGHGSNHWTITVKHGTTVAASWTTDSDVSGQGTLGADTIVNPVLVAADVVAPAAAVVSLSLVKAASAADLPAGRVVIHFRRL